MTRNRSQAEADDAAFIADLNREYARIQAEEKITKRAALRIAMVNLLAEGLRKPGDKLPPESLLTRHMDVSLGTVQSAYSQLREIGLILRRRGDGTRVAERSQTNEKIRHFRIPAPGGGFRAALMEQGKVEIETGEGPWTEYLGRPQTCTVVRRHLVHAEGSEVFADMYFDAALAPGLAGTQAEELKFTNIRPILEQSAGIKVAHLTNRIRFCRMDGTTAAGAGIPPAGEYFEVEVRAATVQGDPVYFLRWLMPAESGELEFEDRLF